MSILLIVSILLNLSLLKILKKRSNDLTSAHHQLKLQRLRSTLNDAQSTQQKYDQPN